MNLLGPAKFCPDKSLGLAKVNRILTRGAYCDKTTGIFPHLEYVAYHTVFAWICVVQKLPCKNSV